jgi:DNA polymerase elongation subunit (family B)
VVTFKAYWFISKEGTKMISSNLIKKTLFFDIETTTRYKTWEEYLEKEPNSAKDFETQILMKREWAGVPIEKIYPEKGMLSPEHGQIVSICSRIWNSDEKKWDDRVFGFSSWDEYESIEDKKNADKDILIPFNEYLIELFGTERGTFGGYNINNFDIPYVYRRVLRTGLLPQTSLVNVNLAKWEKKNLDLMDWWNGTGAAGWSGFSSACEMMNVGSSKEEGVDGRHVCNLFWDDQNIQGINDYCMRDVIKSAQFAISLSDEKLTKRHEEVLVDYLQRMEQKETKKENEVGE